MRSRWILVVIGLVAFALSFGREYRNAHNVDLAAVQPYADAQRPYAGIYAYPTDGWQARLNQRDGQAFAQLATDPALRRPLVFLAGRPEAAYRAQRPLFGWLTWIASGGQRDAVPIALYVVTSLTVATLVVLAGAWITGLGSSPLFGLGMLFVPGVDSIVTNGGADVLGAALLVAALLVHRRAGPWPSSRSTAATVGLLTLAALTRETMLLAAFVLAVSSPRSRRVLIVAVPVAAYVAWISLVRWRFGSWPFDGGDDGKVALLTGPSHWFGSWRPADWVVSMAGFAVALLAMAVRPKDVVAWIAAAYAGVSLTFGPAVWRQWEDFGRVLLPLWVTGLLVIFGALIERLAAGESHARPIVGGLRSI